MILVLLIFALYNTSETRKLSNEKIKVVNKSVKQLISAKSNGNSVELLNDNSSCVIIDCNKIICSFISAQNDPGKVAGYFIDKYFKVNNLKVLNSKFK